MPDHFKEIDRIVKQLQKIKNQTQQPFSFSSTNYFKEEEDEWEDELLVDNRERAMDINQTIR